MVKLGLKSLAESKEFVTQLLSDITEVLTYNQVNIEIHQSESTELEGLQMNRTKSGSGTIDTTVVLQEKSETTGINYDELALDALNKFIYAIIRDNKGFNDGHVHPRCRESLAFVTKTITQTILNNSFGTLDFLESVFKDVVDKLGSTGSTCQMSLEETGEIQLRRLAIKWEILTKEGEKTMIIHKKACVFRGPQYKEGIANTKAKMIIELVGESVYHFVIGCTSNESGRMTLNKYIK